MTESAPPSSGTDFVGRRAEVARLEAVWAAVESDRRQVVFVGGEPGVGKTRLVSEAAAALRAHGATVLWGACRQDLDIPYRPFVAILEQAIEQTPPDILRAIAPAAAAPLLRLTTSVSRYWPSAQPIPGDRDSRPALFDALLRLLLATAERCPLVLVLEDVQWAPEPTLAMLSHLVESTAGERLLVLATLRTTAPDRTDEVSFALADLHRLDGVARIDLAGLSTEEVAEYLVRAAGVSPGSARSAAPVLRDHTGGNPFFLQEYWYDLATRGGLTAARSGVAAPRSIQDALARRLAAFDVDHARVIELAAVAGDLVDPEILTDGLDSNTVLAGIDFGVRAGLLVAGAADGEYRFAHALARQAVLDRMSAGDLAAAHARVALAVEERDPTRVAALAHHFFRARTLGYADKAVRYLVLAARQAERGIAHREAAVLYERAAQAHAAHGPTRVELLSAAARCHLHGGDFPPARRLYEDLAADGDPRARLIAAIGHESASWRPSVSGQRSLALLSEALSAAALDRDDPLSIRARASMGRAASFTGDARQARLIGEDALAGARAIGDPELLAHALCTTLWQGLRPDLAPQLLARAIELNEIGSRLGDDDYLGPAAFHRAVFAYLLGDEATWSSAQRDLTELALAQGQPFFRYVAGCSRCAHRFAVGDFAGTERIIDWLDDQFAQEFGGATEGSWGVQQFMLRRVTGGLEQVRPLVSGRESFDDHWLPGLLALYTELEMWEPAARVLAHLCDRLGDHRFGAQWAGLLAFATEAAVRLEDTAVAATLRPLLAEYTGANLMAGASVAVFGSADRYLAELDSVLGAHSADQHFEHALAMDRRMGAVTHQAETLAAWYRHRLRHPGTVPGPAAADLATEARALARRIGHRRILRDLDADPAPRAEHVCLPNGLTDREVDVLRLVADGLSNREIGERLFISANTAANHVRSILIKTAAPNRTRAAIFATEHGLL
ncbi:ATP-binding protein [Nocardia mangyaensis]|uniref:ATP-binding protein n=1 Tax=Nocardia mangyaensis TaxID=2213200 RepID=UPI0012EB4B2A|nr:helix-turn-helix transcriptional regulator [Nocardia mangyaensis]